MYKQRNASTSGAAPTTLPTLLWTFLCSNIWTPSQPVPPSVTTQHQDTDLRYGNSTSFVTYSLYQNLTAFPLPFHFSIPLFYKQALIQINTTMSSSLATCLNRCRLKQLVSTSLQYEHGIWRRVGRPHYRKRTTTALSTPCEDWRESKEVAGANHPNPGPPIIPINARSNQGLKYPDSDLASAKFLPSCPDYGSGLPGGQKMSRFSQFYKFSPRNTEI